MALRTLPGLADHLEKLVPSADFRRSAKARNDIAIALNNSATPLDIGGPHHDLRGDLLTNAAKYIVDEDDTATIADNVAAQRAYRRPSTPSYSAPRTPAYTPPGRQSSRVSGITAVEWADVTRLTRTNQFGEAQRRLLAFKRYRTLDATDRARVDVLLRQLANMPAGLLPAQYTWFANLALCFGSLTGVTWLMFGIWDASVFLSVAVAVVATVLPLLVVYSGWYRKMMPPGLFVFVGLVLSAFVVVWLVQLMPYASRPLWWAMGVFVFMAAWLGGLAKRMLYGRTVIS